MAIPTMRELQLCRVRRRSGAMLLATVGLAGCSANLASGPPSDAGQLAGAGPQEVASLTSPTPPEVVSRPKSAAPRTDSGPRARNLAELARASAENPRDATLALAYVRVLKASGRRAEALAVLDAAADSNPDQHVLVIEQGLLALELGQSAKALVALEKAAPSSSDWRVLSALGVAASSQGQQQEAQRHFGRALALSPNNAVVLNNMAMSLLLDRQVEQAEALLRRAARAGSKPQQVAHNLALTQALKREGAVAQE